MAADEHVGEECSDELSELSRHKPEYEGSAVEASRDGEHPWAVDARARFHLIGPACSSAYCPGREGAALAPVASSKSLRTAATTSGLTQRQN